ncbi:tripartite motif-containing protein 16-like protein [Pundamilia nyererei]|uniref:Tripartite motif-containing protein 16-like protein n=1 Tax=Pundamilia nyererei TaxID=303518 RepID=A0A9Y6JJ08_9CICH|nr:PREDICTED: tripartite motif-containing protein 16-like protein [Pundamilia nyererei]
MLAELVEDLKISGHQAASADLCYAGPEDVSCDVCTEEKLKAVKSSFLSEEWRKITLTVRSVDVLLPQIEPKTRDDFLKHSCQLTIDPDTVHKNLFLSNQNRTVSDSAPNPNIYPGYKKRDRFSNHQQVLSKDSLIGPCYWEVEWKGKGLSVAVTYKNKNKLDQSDFGSNNKSWALECYGDCYKFSHNKITTPLSGPLSSKVGVYVDPRAGVLSFYSVSDTMALLHRVQTTFTKPLYAGLWIWKTCLNFAEIIEILYSGNTEVDPEPTFISSGLGGPWDPTGGTGKNGCHHNPALTRASMSSALHLGLELRLLETSLRHVEPLTNTPAFICARKIPHVIKSRSQRAETETRRRYPRLKRAA